MYQTGPSTGGLDGVLMGATTAMGGIMAEAIESKKAQTNLINFADTLEKQGLIGDAMIYRQMAASETPNLIQAARTGQATKRDMSAPFEHALRALNEQADRQVRLDVAKEDGSSLSADRTRYNAGDEIDAADLQMITSELNGIDNRRYSIQNRLSDAEKAGDATLVQQLESDLKQLNDREAELRTQAQQTQAKRRARAATTFEGGENSGGSIADAQANLPPLPGDETDAVRDGLPVYTPEGGPESAPAESLLPDETMRKGVRKPTTNARATADAFAGVPSSVTENDATGFTGKSEPVIPDVQPSVPGVKANDQKSNSELAAQGKLDYTKNLGLPSDASTRTVRARRNFLEQKQQVFVQLGKVYNEAVDKAQTPEALKIAREEALKTQRKQTGLTSPEEAKKAGDTMLAAMGPDAKNFVVKVERKGDGNYDVDIVKKSAAGVTKTGQTFIANGKIFAPDSTGAMVRIDPSSGEQTEIMSLDPDNPNKRLTYAEFETMVTQYSPERLAEILHISVEEAKQMTAVVVGSAQKPINKGATPIAPTEQNNVYKNWR